MKEITYEYAHELFTLSSDGELVWKKRLSNRIRIGDIAGCKDIHGYLNIGIHGSLYKAHRIVWLMTHGEWPTHTIDHINRTPWDNRPENLREATYAQQQQNKGKKKRCSSKHKGVYWDSTRGKWAFQVYVDGRLCASGRFDCEMAAFEAYVKHKRDFHQFHPVMELV